MRAMRSVVFVFSILTAGCAALGIPISGAPPSDGGAGASSDGGRAEGRDGGIPSLDMRAPMSFDGGTSRDLAAPADFAIGLDLRTPSYDLASSDMAVSSALCMTGGSVAYLDGDPGDWIHPGAETIHLSNWEHVGTEADTFWYESNATTTNWWSFAFSSLGLGQPLDVGRYDSAMRHPFETAGHPGLDISGRGHGCNTLSGWFEIESITGDADTGVVTELTATFEQHCEDGAAALRGCIHFEN